MKIKRLIVILTILTLTAALLPLTAQAVTLKEGNRSQSVESLQQALKSKGYFSATSTGYYGDITVEAVKNYQKDNGLTADGVAGKDTLISLGLMSEDDAIQMGTVNISQGLNLRYGPSSSNTLLCELENGSEVEILSENGGWYRIRTSFDIEGYVYKSYIKVSASNSSSSSSVQQGKVKVNTRLNVRSGPGTSYSIKGYLPNNASVVISGSQNGWYTITSSSGLSGYCSAQYITISGQSSDNGSGNSGTAVNQTGKVKVNTRLTIRSGPGTSYSAKGYLSNNTSVTISEILDGWYKIQTTSGITGYCSADYITVTGENTDQTAQTKQGVVNVNTRLTVRSGPGTSYSALGYLNDNASVTIHETSGDWHKISTPTGMSGYCHVDYITVNGSGSSSESSDSSVPTETLKYGMTSNDVVKLQQRLKELGYFSASCTGYFGTITLSAVKSFQKDNSLDVDGIAGPKTLNALFEKDAEAKPEEPETPTEPSDETEELIEELLAYAKTFLGTPYVYGANGPDSFDCTGYTCYVFKHFGYSLPRTAYNQGYNNYAPKIENVEDLKPGDLVFFNTISDNDLSDHAGIYLGDNMFIHCNSGSSMSVVIQDITNSYYKPRFSWGRRVIS